VPSRRALMREKNGGWLEERVTGSWPRWSLWGTLACSEEEDVEEEGEGVMLLFVGGYD
jgi:hypothetical protein